jgi:hypothetical protein
MNIKHIVLVLALSAVASTQAWSQTVAEAQKKALAKHPDLGREGSPFHTKFLSLYKEIKEKEPKFLSNPSWPIVLADRTEEALWTEADLADREAAAAKYAARESADAEQKAKQKAKQKAEKQAAQEALLKAANIDPKAQIVHIEGKITQIGEMWLLVTVPLNPYYDGRSTSSFPRVTGATLYVTGHPKQDEFVDGDFIDVDAGEDGIYTSGTRKLQRYKVLTARPVLQSTKVK